MIIAVTSTGETLDSLMDERFGRAPYFLLVDSETEKLVKVIVNTECNAAHGVGIASAQMICNSGAEVLLTGNLGPKAQQVFDSSNMKYVTGMNGTVLDAVHMFINGNRTSETDSISFTGTVKPVGMNNTPRDFGQLRGAGMGGGRGTGRGMGGGGGRGAGGCTGAGRGMRGGGSAGGGRGGGRNR